MIFNLLFFAILSLFLLNLFLIKKIPLKSHKQYSVWANVILIVVFAALLVVMNIIKVNYSSFVDRQIQGLEIKSNELYPGIFEKQMGTSEIKTILESSLEISDSGTIQSVLNNLIKSKIRNFSSFALTTIKELERTEDSLSVKEALLSIKEKTNEIIISTIYILRTIIALVFLLLFAISLIAELYFSKNSDKKNRSIVFGTEDVE